jgi:phage-related protein (TIGR01555 family)
MMGIPKLQWVDSFVNLLAGMGVPGRDKFASQSYSFVPMTQFDLESAYRGDWIARKVIDIPAFDMTREWREWQADEAQVELIEELEKNLFVQQKVQQALIKSRLYGGAIMIMGVDNGAPEEELDPETVGKDSLKFLHVVSAINVAVGPLDTDVTSPYYGLPTWYEVRSGPQGSLTQQVQLHPSRVVRFMGMPPPDAMLSGQIWGDSILQPVNDAVKMCGLVTGSLATLISELKIDIIKIPDMTEIVSTEEGTRKLQTRFSTANAMKSVINTVVLDTNEEWERVQANLAGVPEIITTYLQIASGAADIPAGRFLGLPHRGLNVTGEADFRNYYDKLAGEQTTILTPAMSVLDEVIIRSALGSRPPEIYYEWNSLWQLSDGDKADIALKKAQAYQIDVNAAQIPPVALANGRVNQLIEDGTYPGLQNALEDAAAEGDTIEEQNAPQPMMGVDPMTGQSLDPNTGEPLDPNAPPPNGGNGSMPPPKGNGQTGQLPPNARKSTLPGGRGAGDSAPFDDEDDVGYHLRAPPLPPINVNITMPPSNRVKKTVTTHRDEDGNLVAEVREQDE